MKKKEYLMKELERLRKQQGEFTQRLNVVHLLTCRRDFAFR